MSGLIFVAALAAAYPLACWLSDRFEERSRKRWEAVSDE